MELDRMISAQAKPDEETSRALRPRVLAEYIGQARIRDQLSLFIKAALQRGESLDHVLLAGPPGLGKTTLAHIIAAEMGVGLHVIAAPNIEKKGDLAALLTTLQPRDVLFIDEIHRLPRTLEEILYSAMEDFRLDVVMGQGPAAQTLRLDLPPFTLVGATTRTGMLSNPLKDRFGMDLRLDYYPVDELEQIVERSARLLKIALAPEVAHALAQRARGTPRIANRLLRRARDYSQVRHPESVQMTLADLEAALLLLEVDTRGLDALDRRLIRMILEGFSGGPVGIENLAAALGEDRETLEDSVEPYLIQSGLIQRTPRGRISTERAAQHLGVPLPTVVVPEIQNEG